MSWYPLDGTIFFVGSTTEQGPLDIADVTDSSWQGGTGHHSFSTPSRFQQSRISVGLSQDLDWRGVMSWYTVDGTGYTVTGTAQQGSLSSPLRASVIARGSAQSEPWDLGDYWPWWRWDSRGLLVGWYSERSVWDPGIERSLHNRVMQRIGKIRWRIRDPRTFCSVGGEHQLERRLVQALLEDKQFLAGRTVIFPISSS